MIAGVEGFDVGLDQAFVAVDLVEALAHRLAVGRSGRGDRQRGQVQRIVGIGHPDRRRDVADAFDIRVLGHHRLDDPLAHRPLFAEEAVGLHEMHVLAVGTGQLGEAPARGPPVRDHRHFPAHPVQRLDHLRGRSDVGHQEQRVGARRLQPGELGHHVQVVALELLDPGGRHALGGQRRLQALLVGFAPGVVDQDQAGLGGLESPLRVRQHADVDRLVDSRHPEREVRRRAILGDAGAGRPGAHEGHLLLVDDRHDRHRHRGIESTEQHRHLFAEDQFARGHHALGRIGLIVAAHQLELAPAQQAALRIDLVDGHLQAARQRFAGQRRLPGQRRHQTDLDGVGRQQGSAPGGQRQGAGARQQAAAG